MIPDPTIQQQSAQSDQAKWKDPKRYLWLLSPALPIIGLGALTGYAIAPKRLRALSWAGPALVHGIIPALDKLVGTDTSNPPTSAIDQLEKDKYYSAIVKAFIPAQYAATFLGAWLAGRKNIPASDYLGLTLTVGAINGIAINTGHELSHKHGRADRILSMVALAPTGYTHFAVEHPFGHHKRVATPEDPASSRMGESFWKFLPRTVIGGFKSAYDIEKRRLERKGKSFWCLENELLQGWAMSAGVFAAATVVGGRRSIPFLVGQAAYGASLLEVINYVEHYGLKRRQDENGKYERTKPEHSWNSNQVVTNLFLYQLQRHSDHHAHPTRSFQALRHFEDAPQLPSGYASMLLPAYIPSWWYKLMDERVIKHYKGDLSRINMDPENANAVLAKYADLANEVAAQAAQQEVEIVANNAETDAA
ncbi:MAG: alkane 1-monooxygenase [Moraxellaceae bacterium]|nr:alkane 1-monooxygenase [Moraxellaceae bacterium]MDP1775132.1 alkane 1-monooxygenase [Moraxellaceae bacterium]MDZ4297403.1 alkane 1-monooxygenase [Moraxellaceae bacterium]MDZ4386631.1 alkane 1-monooxygenase [Moraxellaceae bacterium]